MFDAPTLQPAPTVAAPLPSQPDFLVIGYGSDLHGDDGVGPWIANLVAGLEWPGVRCFALTQLTPDLASELSRAKAVVFVDASVRVAPGHFQVGSLTSASLQTLDSHHCTPATLLSLARELYGHAPVSWTMNIGASNFALGHPISPAVTRLREAILREMTVLRAWTSDAE
ncbi:MAG: hydrogenase maturation protease [Verrucomicrobiales bacterium]|nr:hydrogenase maturation protease [Verrucomicrobiales bacterium]